MADFSRLARFDPATPSEARIYDYLLGGKDNFAADRELARAVLDIAPELPLMCREGRRCVERVVTFLAMTGITQFIDLGCGLPTPRRNVHDFARKIVPDARVAYVDIDPMVIVHGRALLEDGGPTAMVKADAREPDLVLDDPRLRQTIDLDRPVAVLMMSLLTSVQDDDIAARIPAHFRKAVVPGSFIAITHAVSDVRPNVTARLMALLGGPDQERDNGQLRTRAEVERYFEGMDMVRPGLVYLPEWRPAPGIQRSRPESVWAVCGVGRRT
ncbi:SAM-dependent methyltransferase [Sinosporangium siamense]|uniref:SAM-dependent methyltransferase n=1 Tax=Sinosporangium siamense TaxID=1367973 RepID=A0A919RKA8_9ACTN|nr:SAM-dependent methyltransferase [Sinosporangium siamense]GII95392.1 SAM-dependent methyltransferase [Sinosporangium siamense]